MKLTLISGEENRPAHCVTHPSKKRYRELWESSFERLDELLVEMKTKDKKARRSKKANR